MGLITLPDPVSMFESAKNAGFARDEVNAFISMAYSAQITFLWRSGSSKWAQFVGEGQALKDAATAMYLSLEVLQKKNFLTLTVPTDMLQQDLSRFQTQFKTK